MPTETAEATEIDDELIAMQNAAADMGCEGDDRANAGGLDAAIDLDQASLHPLPQQALIDRRRQASRWLQWQRRRYSSTKAVSKAKKSRPAPTQGSLEQTGRRKRRKRVDDAALAMPV